MNQGPLFLRRKIVHYRYLYCSPSEQPPAAGLNDEEADSIDRHSRRTGESTTGPVSNSNTPALTKRFPFPDLPRVVRGMREPYAACARGLPQGSARGRREEIRARASYERSARALGRQPACSLGGGLTLSRMTRGQCFLP